LGVSKLDNIANHP